MKERLTRWQKGMTRREFLQLSGLVGAGLLFNSDPFFRRTVPSRQMTGFPGDEWRSSSPDEQGIDSRGILAMLEHVINETPHVHSFLLIRNGTLVTEAHFAPFNRTLPHILFSGTKSITSTLMGIAIAEGYIQGVDRKVLDFFPEMYDRNPVANLEKLTIEHLLTMSTGHVFPVSPNPYKPAPVDWVEIFLANPANTMLYDPGTVFMYSSGASHTIAAILQKVIGRKLVDYAAEKLFNPLGISPYDWGEDQNGINFGNSWLRLKAEDMARFGYLYLKRGNWNGKQVVPVDWVERSTRKCIETRGIQINAAEQDGYGYFFWMNGFGGYSVHGYGGQYVFVIPEMDLVAVFTGGYDDDVFDVPYKLMRDYIVPSVKLDAPLAKGTTDSSRRLREIIVAINNPVRKPVPVLPEIATQLSGNTYLLEDGVTTLTFSFQAGEDTFNVKITRPQDDHGTLVTDDCTGGLDDLYRLSRVADPVLGFSVVGLKGRWLDASTFELEQVPTDYVTRMLQTGRFEGDHIRLNLKTLFTGKVASEIEMTASLIN